MRIALINTNQMKPPVAPIGLDYLAEACAAADMIPDILDLCFEEKWENALEQFLQENKYDLIGLSLRNTDDCAYTDRCSFLQVFNDIIKAVRQMSDAYVVIGGVGFSVMPEEILEACGADAGIWAEGEQSFLELARALENRDPIDFIPNLIIKQDGKWCRTEKAFLDPAHLPTMERIWFDNVRYEEEGGQIGFETSRGCPHDCIYCADPVAKGSALRLRSPEDIADELEALSEQGISYFHTCDCEFNNHPKHAKDVCKAIIDRELHEKITWYAYCSPGGFTKGLAVHMQDAGCAGINFGTDSGDPKMLEIYKRSFSTDDIRNAAAFCKDVGIASMFDLLIGGPGETEDSIYNTIHLFKEADPDLVGVTVGLRVYPGTELAAMAERGELDGGLAGEGTLDSPLFYLEPGISEKVNIILRDHINGDPRFIFFDPDNEETNYNYNANTVLSDAIKAGFRGAYWDILRRYRAK